MTNLPSVSQETCLQDLYSSGILNMVMTPAGHGTKNDSSGNGQQ
jgi:hypothetical protein